MIDDGGIFFIGKNVSYESHSQWYEHMSHFWVTINYSFTTVLVFYSLAVKLNNSVVPR